MTSHEARQYTAVQLAFLGDAVWALEVRARLMKKPGSAGALHRRSVDYVCAGAQARLYDAIAGRLGQEEDDLLRRGRNAHAGPAPRGASQEEYGKATALEALVGYYYLSGRRERIEELVGMAFSEREAPPKKGENEEHHA